jgi:Aspartyl/Asparaginyl beta-hydroxylase
VRNFHLLGAGIDVSALNLELYRQSELWNQHRARTNGPGSFTDTDDIWCRFRPAHELVSPESYVERFDLVWYPAWHALPHLRPIVFGLMARCEAVQLGGVLITRVPAGRQVKPHDDRGRWHPEWFATKAYVPLMTNNRCVSTCDGESVVMEAGSAWAFDNLKTHSTVNDGNSDRVTLIVSLRCE